MKYQNPVRRGFYPDPSIVRVGEDYYMVNSTFQYFPAIVISHSRDLVNWETIGHAITENDFLDLSEILDSRGIWAPDISYHNGEFYIMATFRQNESEADFGRNVRKQLVVHSKNPEGPYSKPVFLENDNIDPSHFVDDDGKHYMVIAPAATVVPLNDDLTEIIGESVQVWAGTGERCSEGPHIFKRNGWYYAVVAEGGTGYGHGINAARSRSLFGPYEASPYNPVLRQRDPEALIQRMGHGDLVETNIPSVDDAAENEWWLVYLCGRRNGGDYTTIGRETALDRVKWLEDDWFIINDGVGSEEAQAPELQEVKFDKWERDDFDSDKLSLDWQFVRNPDYSMLSLTERKGYLRLYATEGTLDEIRAKNTLLRRESEHCYKAKTCLEFKPENDEQAGLTCYYSTATYIRFCVRKGAEGKYLELALNKNCGDEVVERVYGIEDKPIYLTVIVEGQSRSFYYGYSEEEEILVKKIDNCIFLSDEGVPEDRKRHTGTLVGIYANGAKGRNRTNADFAFFSCTDKLFKKI